MSLVERIARRLWLEQAGFSLIEMLVAATLTAGGLAAVLTVFDSSRDLVTQAERNQTATHQADQELERVLAMDYDDIGHSPGQTPLPSSQPTHPDHYVKAGANYQYDHKAGGRTEPLVTGSGTLTRYRNWADGRLSGRVYRYVTWVFDPHIVQTPTDQPDAKRITVAVTVQDGNDHGRLKPVVTSSIVFDRSPDP